MKILKEASRKGPGKETFLPSPFKLRMAGSTTYGYALQLEGLFLSKIKETFFHFASIRQSPRRI